MMHESNTFAAFRTGLADFGPFMDLEGLNRPGWRGHLADGVVRTLQQCGAVAVPTLFGRALVGGAVERSAYETMKNGLLEAVANAGSGTIDGICLALHGSMYAVGVDDPEGELLEELRLLVGDNMPIVCALDMHAKMTDRMLRSANAFAAYRTAPHVDVFETGVRAARLVMRCVNERLKLRTYAVRVPMLLCGEQSETDAEPMKSLIESVRNVEQRSPAVASADYLLGFPWADTPHHGVSAIAVGEERHLASLTETAREMACAFWERRREFGYTTEAYFLDEALTVAARETGRPVVLSDTGDNPTAGASGDLTLVLNRLLELGWQETLVAVIADAAASEACSAAGEGGRVRLGLGRLDPGSVSGETPLDIEAEVVATRTVRGTSCCVVRTGGVTVVIAASRKYVTDPADMAELGLDLSAFKLIVVKSGYVSPEYGQLAARKLFALTPGDTNIDMASIPYRTVPRPIYPLDRDMEWRP